MAPQIGSRRVQLIVAGVVVLALVAIGLLVFRPSGADEPAEAAFERVADEAEEAEPVLILEREWGEGRLVLVGYNATDPDDTERMLGLAFAIDRGRGWRVAGWTSQASDLEDVKVGSLLVANSTGGAGQPPWVAVFGELGDDRIVQVEVEWSEGEPTAAQREGDAYFVVRPDGVEPTFVRYLDAEDEELAKVPAQPA